VAEAAERRLGAPGVGRFSPPRQVVQSVARYRRSLAVSFALGLLLLAFASVVAAAQPAKKNPSWSDLTPEHQQILAPLSGSWNELEPERKRKWIGIAKRYPKMTPTGQKRVQTRMEKWAKLSPEQRREVREKYRRIEKMPPEKRETLSRRWSEYQALPPAERQKLAPPPKEPRSSARKGAREKRTSKVAGESGWEW